MLYMSSSTCHACIVFTCRYEQQLEDLQTTQSNILSELHEKQEMSERMKGEVQAMEANLQEAELKKISVRTCTCAFI